MTKPEQVPQSNCQPNLLLGRPCSDALREAALEDQEDDQKWHHTDHRYAHPLPILGVTWGTRHLHHKQRQREEPAL